MTDTQKKDDYKGEPLPDELGNGPIEHRSCTDILCCLFFVAFFCGFFGVTIWGLSNGNPQLIGRGYDYDGKICGYSPGYESYDLLYFAWPTKGELQYTVCVSACDGTSYPPTGSVVTCKTNSYFTDCSVTNDAGTSAAITPAAATTNYKVTNYYPSYALFGRYCVPTSAATYSGVSDVTSKVADTDTFQNWISDLRTTWPVILGMAGLAIALGFVYMFLVRYCAGVMVWGSILGIIVALAVLGGLYYKGGNDTANQSEGGSNTQTNSSNKSHKVLAYVCWGGAGFIFLAVCCLFSRIKLAVAIMKAAADYVKATPMVFLVPPAFMLILLSFYVYCGITVVYLFSAGDPTKYSNSLPIGSFSYSSTEKRMILYVLFGILWGNAFFIACSQFIIASSAAIWYFTQPDTAHGTVGRSVKRLWRYHLGSIAFGSFILAVVQFVRLILAYIQKQVEKNGGSQNKCILFVLKCMQCYVACFERFIKFLNKNAYIQIALTGKNFCVSAKNAFFLILRNPIRFGVTATIGTIFIAFGKLLIASFSTLIGYIIIKNAHAYKDKVYSPLFPSFAIFVTTWAIASVFLSVYGLAADTILACFVVDEEIHKKNNQSALHCPATLRDFIEHNKSVKNGAPNKA